MEQRFCDLRLACSKEPLIRTMNDLIKNKKVEDESLYVIEGLWAYEKIMSGGVKPKAFVFCPEAIENNNMLGMVQSLAGLADDSCLISRNLCKKLSSRDSEEGFFLLFSMQPKELEDIELKEDNLVVILDGLEQAGNIGTIVRSADAAGEDGVILCNSRVRKTNQKLIKSSMGSCFTMPVIEDDIVQTAGWLQNNGFKVIVTDLQADQSYYDIDYSGRIAIVAGNEIRGVSAYWHEHSCERVLIPMHGAADSLNVGVAASLVIYEASSRQKKIVKRPV